jgi:hypothetical protein
LTCFWLGIYSTTLDEWKDAAKKLEQVVQVKILVTEMMSPLAIGRGVEAHHERGKNEMPTRRKNI